MTLAQCVRFHPNALYLATGSADRTARLWDVQKGSCVRVFAGHIGGITSLAISPDGRHLATAADDATVKIWDIGSGKLMKSLSGHTSRINSLAFSMENTILLSGSNDCTVRMWDVQSTRTPSDQTLSGSELKNLGLSAENFGGLKSASALSLSTSGLASNANGQSSATLSVLPKSAFAEQDPNQKYALKFCALRMREAHRSMQSRSTWHSPQQAYSHPTSADYRTQLGSRSRTHAGLIEARNSQMNAVAAASSSHPFLCPLLFLQWLCY